MGILEKIKDIELEVGAAEAATTRRGGMRTAAAASVGGGRCFAVLPSPARHQHTHVSHLALNVTDVPDSEEQSHRVPSRIAACKLQGSARLCLAADDCA